jgi:hypothetical protein
MVTCAPTLANRLAIAAPMPVPPPVAIATLLADLIDAASACRDAIYGSIDRCSSGCYG